MNRVSSDFRVTFANMDQSALLTVGEVGELIGKSPNALYHMLCRDPDALPKPVFRQNRYVRWRVSDVREWLQNLVAQEPAQKDAKTDGPRRGRRRLSATTGQ
jgi:predicted DNA-binding transcriptional regulator AlpA